VRARIGRLAGIFGETVARLLRERRAREEEGDADGWARAGRGGARARAGWRGADRLARLVSRVVERASRVVGRWRALLGRCVEKG